MNCIRKKEKKYSRHLGAETRATYFAPKQRKIDTQNEVKTEEWMTEKQYGKCKKQETMKS